MTVLGGLVWLLEGREKRAAHEKRALGYRPLNVELDKTSRPSVKSLLKGKWMESRYLIGRFLIYR